MSVEPSALSSAVTTIDRASPPSSSRQDKVIAAMVLLHSSLGLVWVWLVAAQLGFSGWFLPINLALVAVGLIAGVGMLRRQPWGLWLALVFAAMQLPHLLSPDLQFSYTLGLSLVVAVGDFGGVAIGVNLLAGLLLVLICHRLLVRSRQAAPSI